jgi:carbamoyltransferase
MKLLGISCYYHDSAACLVDSGRIVAAAQEERFTRKKHDEGFPTNAVRYCLAEGGVGKGELDGVVFYDKPLLKFHRILETYLAVAPQGQRSAMMALPLWLRERLWIPPRILDALEECGVGEPKQIYFTEHHEAHAASAFYPSPFEEAAVLTLDGVGEWATTTIGVGEGNRLELIREIAFPHSLGLLYSAFTYFTGFRVNSGEYKLMGLAPYGEARYADVIRRELIDVKDDGSFRMNMDYFGYLDGLAMTNDRFAALFGGPARSPESAIGQREMDLARSIQEVTEEIVLKLARHAREITGKRNLCMAGGVALNCVANGVLLRAGIFDDLWIQPAAGDAGGALGAPLAVWHNALGNPRTVARSPRTGQPTDAMRGSLLGPDFPRDAIKDYLDAHGYPYEELPAETWARRIAEVIAGENVFGLCQGRMECGPRALDHRRLALPQDAVGDEPEDQVPGELPAVRAQRARGAGGGLLRARPAEPVYAAGGGRGRAPADSEAGGRAQPSPDRVGEPAALGRPRDHPRRLLGAHPDGGRGEPGLPCDPHRVREADRLWGDRQHQFQRARRADRLHAGRRLPVLHAHRDGLPGARPLPARQAGAAEARREGGLAAGVPVGLGAVVGEN